MDKHTGNDFRFLLKWVVPCVAGLTVGHFVAPFVTGAVLGFDNPRATLASRAVSQAIGWGSAGLSLGTAQWLVLRRSLTVSASWVLATAVASIVAGVLAPFVLVPPAVTLTIVLGRDEVKELLNGLLKLNESGPEPFSSMVAVAVASIAAAVVGFSVGLVQCLLLPRSFSPTALWILANGASLALGKAINVASLRILVLSGVGPLGIGAASLLYVPFGAAIVGLLTGSALLRLRRHGGPTDGVPDTGCQEPTAFFQ